MTGMQHALWARYGRDNVNLYPDGRLYLRSKSTSGRYVWHFMGYVTL
jgi:hypothetical protein